MKYELPTNHGLPNGILEDQNLVPKTSDGSYSITDIQYDALESGVALEANILAVAPTSTGKTNIAMWGLLSWLQNPEKNAPSVVYLVSHKALARQKFEELQSILCDKYFGGDRSAIVLATGDGVEDGTASVSAAPLDAPLLIATYEKYLGLMSGTGIKRDMSNVLVVCDEIQIMSDKTRGRSVEILLTLLKNTNLGQFIGLSAVINRDDAQNLSEWLDLKLLHRAEREKHLVYECRCPDKTLTLDTSQLGTGISEENASSALSTTDIVAELYEENTNLPIVVFCMTVKSVHDCVAAFIQKTGLIPDNNLPLFAGLNEDTQSARQLTKLLQHRIAFHTADLLDHERHLVEDKLRNGEIDIVFSTTTLAAGVNFPFATAVFDSWKRRDQKQRTYIPIPNSEFQNMAGRAGRMGFTSSNGKIIFGSDSGFRSQQTVQNYLNPDGISRLQPQLEPKAFEQVVLWLLSCGMCSTQQNIKDFLFGTFSASIEESSNISGLDHWENKPQEVLNQLKQWGYIL